jgi:hypothetical protein
MVCKIFYVNTDEKFTLLIGSKLYLNINNLNNHLLHKHLKISTTKMKEENSKYPTKYGISTNKTLKRDFDFRSKVSGYVKYENENPSHNVNNKGFGKGDQCHQCKEK